MSVSGKSMGGGSTKSKKSNKSSKNKPDATNRGDAFKSKNAPGDMTRRGLPDPYAYYPLDPASLNKRKARKLKGEFKSVVKGAKKGAAAGRRQRAKRVRTSK